MEWTKGTQFRVGAFVFVGFAVLALVVYLIGERRHLFSRKVQLHTAFREAGGISVGTAVRLAGVTIGEVTAVRIGEDARIKDILIDFEVKLDSFHRLRADTRARVASKGLLGDKIIELSIGSADQRRLAPGESIPGDVPPDIMAAAQHVSEVATRAADAVDGVAQSLSAWASPEMRADVVGAIGDARAVTRTLAQGPGLAHALLFDAQLSADVRAFAHNMAALSGNLASASAELAAVAAEIRQGDGLVHALVYERGGAETVAGLAQVADEISAILREVRTGNGAVHEVIYGEGAGNVVANLEAATADVARILADVRAGRGTLGALLVDPSVYEDLQRTVGELRRSDVLRALVRYSISADERPPPPVVQTAPR